MIQAREVPDTYPRWFDLDAELHPCTSEALSERASTCTRRAGACPAEDDVADPAKCIRLDLDCADGCVSGGPVLSPRSECGADVSGAVVEACAAVCRSCGDGCGRHGEPTDHRCTRPQSRRWYEQACRDLLAAVG